MNFNSPEEHLEHLVSLLNQEAQNLNRRMMQAHSIAQKLGKEIISDEKTGLLTIKDNPKLSKA